MYTTRAFYQENLYLVSLLTTIHHVRNLYIELADSEKQRIISIDGTKNIDWIHKSIITSIEEKGFLDHD